MERHTGSDGALGSALSFLIRTSRVALLAVLLAALGLGERGAAQGVITVTTTAQGIDIFDGGCSLQEAIYSANFDDNLAIVPTVSTNPDLFVRTECAAGSGDDTIVLPASFAAQSLAFQMSSITADAHNYMGPTATPIIFTNITIEANGNRLEHLPNGVNFRAFAVGTAVINLPAA